MIDIRPAEPDDMDDICALHAEAFAASLYGHHGEAELVRALHGDGDALVSLCAWRGQRLVGHILFSRMTVEADGAPVMAAALAPVAVTPAAQRQGVGASLIRAGHEALASLDVSLAFVLGDAGYYGRFGYEVDLAQPFASPYAGPHFMARALDSASPRPQRGVAIHAAAFARLA